MNSIKRIRNQRHIIDDEAIISIFNIQGNYSEASDKVMIEESVIGFKGLTFISKIIKVTIQIISYAQRPKEYN